MTQTQQTKQEENMNFNGSKKQNEWAEKILNSAELNNDQIDNLLWYAGPTMHNQGIMDVTIVIENRNRLAAYADSLGNLRKMTSEERQSFTEEVVSMISGIIHNNISSAAASLGRKGGQSKSEKKAAASRENGKKGGSPKKER